VTRNQSAEYRCNLVRRLKPEGMSLVPINALLGNDSAREHRRICRDQAAPCTHRSGFFIKQPNPPKFLSSPADQASCRSHREHRAYGRHRLAHPPDNRSAASLHLHWPTHARRFVAIPQPQCSVSAVVTLFYSSHSPPRMTSQTLYTPSDRRSCPHDASALQASRDRR
jgi:hypothetical protein